ncbi:nucleotidyl transferase AbiEii/AbiGii toxin family protein [soil metagenome]
MNRDFVEMLSALSAAGVKFLIVGAHALAAHGAPRATGDLDIWVQATTENAARVLTALRQFGAPLLDLSEADLCAEDTVFQIGVPPSRIDILTGISGVGFDDAWERRMDIAIGTLTVATIGRLDFIKNKRASGRPKDLLDLELLPPE